MKKQPTGRSPFELGNDPVEVTFSIHSKIIVYQLLNHFTNDREAIQASINQLIELNESSRKSFDHLVQNQDKVKKVFDKRPNEEISNRKT